MLDRIERGLDRLINTGFARAFQAELVPAEIAAAVRRECDETVTVRGRGRPVAANDYVILLAPADHARLSGQTAALCSQLAQDIRAHAIDQRYVLVGPPAVRLHSVGDLPVGVCRVRCQVLPGAPREDMSLAAGGWIEVEAVLMPLLAEVTVIGRGPEADIRLDDPGVSGRHAAILLGSPASIEDLGSTNGTVVDGRRSTRAELRDGSLIVVGTTGITFRDSRS